MRCLNRDIEKILKNSEIVREKKHYDIRKLALQKNCKFDQNLRFFVQAILPYTDTVKIEYTRKVSKCLNCNGHNIFDEVCSIVEKLPMRFYNNKTSIDLSFDHGNVEHKFVLDNFVLRLSKLEKIGFQVLSLNFPEPIY